MQNLKTLFLLLLFAFADNAYAQDETVIREYISLYKDIAIAEMQRTGVPAAIKLAQGIHETDAGQSVLVQKSNNHFGIKCKTDWTGQTVKHTDDAPNECFRKYGSPLDSYKDHSDFLKKSSRYAALFALNPTDYSGWAYGLKKAGYATNPRYPQVIIKLIEDYQLQDYTLIALGRLKPSEEIFVKADEVMPEKKGKEQNADLKFLEIKPVETTEKKTVQLVSVAEVNKTETPPLYPEGEFKINETRVIYVKRGTAYLAVAEKYGLPLARIFEFNDMKEQDFADKDQLIYIMRKRKTGNDEQHIVKPGETLFDIAQIQAIRLESLLEYNLLKPGMRPATGSVLYLRSKAPAMPALATGK
jgi:hypothetical protein